MTISGKANVQVEGRNAIHIMRPRAMHDSDQAHSSIAPPTNCALDHSVWSSDSHSGACLLTSTCKNLNVLADGPVSMISTAPDPLSVCAGNLHARQAASPAQRCGSLGSPSMYSLSADPSTPPGQVPVSNNGATDASHLDAFGAGPRLATAPVAHPELLASTARFRPAPRVASDKASAPSPQSPGGSTPAVGTSPLEEFPVPPPPTLVPYSISARCTPYSILILLSVFTFRIYDVAQDLSVPSHTVSLQQDLAKADLQMSIFDSGKLAARCGLISRTHTFIHSGTEHYPLILTLSCSPCPFPSTSCFNSLLHLGPVHNRHIKLQFRLCRCVSQISLDYTCNQTPSNGAVCLVP